MERNVRDLLNLYNPQDPLDHAWTIPSPWYFDRQIEELEQQRVFARTWQVVGRADQVRNKGDFFTADLAETPEGELQRFVNEFHQAKMDEIVAGLRRMSPQS